MIANHVYRALFTDGNYRFASTVTCLTTFLGGFPVIRELTT
jgi:hypothetical protein